MKKLKLKNKSKWWLWTEREGIAVSYCNLRDSAHPFHSSFKKFTKTYLGHIYFWDGNKISIYWKQQDLDNFTGYFLKEIKKETDFSAQMEKYHFENGEKLIKYSKNFIKIDFSSKKDNELLDYLNDFEKHYEDLAIYTYIPVIATFALEDKVIPYLKLKLKDKNKENEFGKYFSILTYNSGKSWARLEEENLYKIALMIKNGELINGERVTLALQKHAEEFGWQSLGYQFLGPIMGANDFIPRLKKMVNKRLVVLPTDQKIAQEIIDTEKELKINNEYHNLFQALRKIIYLKEYRDGIYTRSHQHINILLKEIIRRYQVPMTAQYFMKYSEYKDLANGIKVDFNKIAERKKMFMWLCDGQEYYYTGDEAKLAVKREIGNLSSAKNDNKLTGVVASSGIITGVVKIIHNEQDIKKIKAGDVLVAHMTKPSYLPAMRKSSAFITDEGGITCHAAIVSREMKKPCIIGTKIATKVLKDGDMVEVDADKGVVKIMKKVNNN